MSKAKGSDYIKELHALLKKDWKGTYQKYPEQAIFALNDDRVIKALEKRFDSKVTIKEIRSFHYDFYTGLIPICFEFTPSVGNIGLPVPNAFLLLMDSDCNVVAIIDPFDPIQPNQLIPPLPKEGEQPFVLSQDSVTEDLTFSKQELYPVQVRSVEFFKKLTAERKRECITSQRVQTSKTAQESRNDNVLNSMRPEDIITTFCTVSYAGPRGGDYLMAINDDCGLPSEEPTFNPDLS